MKKIIALSLALTLVFACVSALAISDTPALTSKTAQDRVVIEAEGVTVVPEENPEALVIAAQLAALPEDKKMDVFPEEVKSVVAAAIADVPEVEDLSQLAPVDTFKLELSDVQPGAKVKLDAEYGEDVNVIGYIVEFMPEDLALEPIFVLKGAEIEIPEGVTELVVYTVAKK